MPDVGTGTGNFEFELASGVHTELQCGSYMFVDADYGRNPTAFKAFEPSLFVSATVTSRPTEDRVIVVAGLKALPPRFGAAAGLRRALRDPRARV